MKVLKLGLWAAFTIALLVVSVALISQNNELLEIQLFGWTSDPLPKWALMLGGVITGAVLASLFFIVDLIILETKNIRLRRANHTLERTLSQKNPTISSSPEPVLKVEDDV